MNPHRYTNGTDSFMPCGQSICKSARFPRSLAFIQITDFIDLPHPFPVIHLSGTPSLREWVGVSRKRKADDRRISPQSLPAEPSRAYETRTDFLPSLPTSSAFTLPSFASPRLSGSYTQGQGQGPTPYPSSFDASLAAHTTHAPVPHAHSPVPHALSPRAVSVAPDHLPQQYYRIEDNRGLYPAPSYPQFEEDHVCYSLKLPEDPYLSVGDDDFFNSDFDKDINPGVFKDSRERLKNSRAYV